MQTIEKDGEAHDKGSGYEHTPGKTPGGPELVSPVGEIIGDGDRNEVSRSQNHPGREEEEGHEADGERRKEGLSRRPPRAQIGLDQVDR